MVDECTGSKGPQRTVALQKDSRKKKKKKTGNIIRMISYIMIRFVGNVWGRIEIHRGLWWGKLKERNHLEDQA
jgi:hypothetical protein